MSLKVTNNISLTDGAIKDRGIGVNSQTVTQTGTGYQSGTLVIASGATVALPVDELTTPGKYVIIYISGDSAATLQIGPDDTGITVMDELEETESAAGRVSSGVVIDLKASDGDVVVEFFVAED